MIRFCFLSFSSYLLLFSKLSKLLKDLVGYFERYRVSGFASDIFCSTVVVPILAVSERSQRKSIIRPQASSKQQVAYQIPDSAEFPLRKNNDGSCGQPLKRFQRDRYFTKSPCGSSSYISLILHQTRIPQVELVRSTFEHSALFQVTGVSGGFILRRRYLMKRRNGAEDPRSRFQILEYSDRAPGGGVRRVAPTS